MISPSLLERHLLRRERPSARRNRAAAAALAAEQPVLLRRAVADDGMALARLQQLDGRSLPTGERVVAQIGGELVAAAHVPSGVSVADPFRPSAAIAALVSEHARRLGGAATA